MLNPTMFWFIVVCICLCVAIWAYWNRPRANLVVDALARYNPWEPTPLCALMQQYGSDKGSTTMSSGHNYSTLYWTLFESRRNAPLRLFELGLGTNNALLPSNMSHMEHGGKPGASLAAWEVFFPQAMIYGADIDRNILFERGRIQTFYCDQTDPSAIEALWQEPALELPLDIIIDDALHEYDANVCFLEHSAHKLAPGGIFIIEDINTSLVERYHVKCTEWIARYGLESCDVVTIPHSNKRDNTLLIAIKSEATPSKF